MNIIFGLERIQFLAVVFSITVFIFIFELVRTNKIREEYSILWFILSLVFLYISIDKGVIDRAGHLVGIAYAPTMIILIMIGFIFLLLIHFSMVITRISNQNKELIQQLALSRIDFSASSENNKSRICAIVPAYNEEKNIRGVINDLKSAVPDIDIVIINDGSKDNTSVVAGATGQAIVIDLPANLGIGGAVQTGFKYAAKNSYDIAIQFDGDGQHRGDEIHKLVESLMDKSVNMVVGSRFLQKNEGFKSTFIRRIGIKIFEITNSLLIGQKVTDNTSGFRAYDKKVIDFFAQYYPLDYPEPEAVILLGRNGFKIKETAVTMRGREGGSSSITGLTGIYYMAKVLLAILMTSLRKPLIPK